ncbi:MAG: hypothetical protein AVDCRST_MAG23-2891 [uncultured Sphingosinicella sp.]|uniref:Uncharacterized protein n=1 Tax=uncultured Sphingosinicella sp. TaxID=478748 RepID=A0A6J4UG40_9SPHN|nr:MAG: hypothetical protein AVDCRST_MAG23-2891 [uncultured Sphingosinicella sp.]
MRRIFGVMVLASIGWSGAALAQQPGSKALVDAVTACRTESDSQARLRCFDTASAALQQASAAGSLIVVDKNEVRRTRRSLFGFALPKLPFFNGDDSAEEAPEELEAKIASARSLGNDKWQFVLDSGAVWQTSQASPYFGTPKAGQTVKLKKGAMGSYFASREGSRSVRAIRVR